MSDLADDEKRKLGFGKRPDGHWQFGFDDSTLQATGDTFLLKASECMTPSGRQDSAKYQDARRAAEAAGKKFTFVNDLAPSSDRSSEAMPEGAKMSAAPQDIFVPKNCDHQTYLAAKQQATQLGVRVRFTEESDA